VFLELPRRVAKVLLGQPRNEDDVIWLRMRQDELAHQAGGMRQSAIAALRGLSCMTGRQGEAGGSPWPIRRYRGVGKLTAVLSAR
jgi:hypothetical protein